MPTIDPALHTVIVRFQVPPENQKALLDELVPLVGHTVATLPGFRSATFGASEDGTTVVNLAQWDSSDAYELAMSDDVAVNSGVPQAVARHGAREAHLDAYQLVQTLLGP